MTRVIIVRHGQSTYNIEKRIQGRSDASSLTAKGQNDASQAGKALSSISFQAIYSSPLQRAKSTAEIIRSQLATQSPVIQIDENLVEVDFIEKPDKISMQGFTKYFKIQEFINLKYALAIVLATVVIYWIIVSFHVLN
jgi:broad specificity phosphatase PhoE